MHLTFCCYGDWQLEIHKPAAQDTKDAIAREVISVLVYAERLLAAPGKQLLTTFGFLLSLN